MPRKAPELPALTVARMKTPGLHAVGGVAGLHLQITASGARSWILRVAIGGRRRDMGLGGFPDVSLQEAREKARAARRRIEDGVDPIEERRVQRGALAAATSKALTFEDAVRDYIAAHSIAWRNAKHRQQWESTLAEYAVPVIGALDVRQVETAHILKILQPIWAEKTETATRLRGRIERVLSRAAKVLAVDHYANPARWQGHLQEFLAAPTKIKQVRRMPALPFDEVPPFMRRLREAAGMGARCLEFVVLTAVRSGNARGAVWAEIDLDECVWTIPAGRMKAGREHKVPLSSPAVELLKSLPRFVGSDVVFPAPEGGFLSDMTLTAVLRRMGVPAVPHGFRSSFCDWSAERTNYPQEVVKMALAHTIGDKVEAAYRRGDLFLKRRRLMDAWAGFVTKAEAGQVVASLRKTA